MEQIELLETIGKIFDKLGIPYLITGGMAVAVWGKPRFTADVDVVVELMPQKLDQLAKELLRIDKDVYLDKQVMREAMIRRDEFSFFHPASGLKVDFWVLKNDPCHRLEMKRRIAKIIGKQRLFFASPEDLILSKLRWYQKTLSTRQLEDIESVLRIQKKIDMRYLRQQTAAQGTPEVLEGVLDKLNQNNAQSS